MSAMVEDRAAVDTAIAEVEEGMSVLFSRAHTVWRDAAARIHPDLQPVGYKILSAIVRLGQTNAHLLAETLELDKSVVSRQVRMLEENGFLVSRADERDGRARVLVPTPLAQERVTAVRADRQNQLRELLKTWPEHELRLFAEMLRRIGEN